VYTIADNHYQLALGIVLKEENTIVTPILLFDEMSSAIHLANKLRIRYDENDKIML
jgi:hypothetical protein